MGIDRHALARAAEIVGRRFGSLDDLPDELANTIANQCYRAALLIRGIDPSTGAGEGSGFESFIEEFPDLHTILSILPRLVEELRRARDAGHEDLFEKWGQVTVDAVKYGIEDVCEKTSRQRAIERRVRAPDEIPELHELLRAFGPAAMSGLEN